MKKHFFFVVITIMMASCSKNNENDPQISNADLVGKWNWTSTDGGVFVQLHVTPESTGLTYILNLAADYTFTILENDVVISDGTYELSLENAINSGTIERIIKISDETLQTDVVFNGIIKSDGTTILNINDNNADGLGSSFLKTE